MRYLNDGCEIGQEDIKIIFIFGDLNLVFVTYIGFTTDIYFTMG